MTTLHDRLEARIDQFGAPTWMDGMSSREWESARADRYGVALFHLLGMLAAMLDTAQLAPTKTGIAGAITASLDRAQSGPGTHANGATV